MKYKIIDKQGSGLKEDAIWNSREEIRQHLIDYHSVDSVSDLTNFTLEEICDYGDWNVEEII